MDREGENRGHSGGVCGNCCGTEFRVAHAAGAMTIYRLKKPYHYMRTAALILTVPYMFPYGCYTMRCGTVFGACQSFCVGLVAVRRFMRKHPVEVCFGLSTCGTQHLTAHIPVSALPQHIVFNTVFRMRGFGLNFPPLPHLLPPSQSHPISPSP